jgi:hypothetical protein
MLFRNKLIYYSFAGHRFTSSLKFTCVQDVCMYGFVQLT